MRMNFTTRNKYHNVKTRDENGVLFDSAKEKQRWDELRILEAAGEITDLKRQVRFVLFPQQEVEGQKIRSCVYIADFVYMENGKQVVEDIKGMRKGTAYEVFKVKKKWMFQRYGIWVREI